MRLEQDPDKWLFGVQRADAFGEYRELDEQRPRGYGGGQGPNIFLIQGSGYSLRKN